MTAYFADVEAAVADCVSCSSTSLRSTSVSARLQAD